MRNPFRRRAFCGHCGGRMAWLRMSISGGRYDRDTGKWVYRQYTEWACRDAFDSEGSAWNLPEDHDGVARGTVKAEEVHA